jgi:hypothetical protein
LPTLTKRAKPITNQAELLVQQFVDAGLMPNDDVVREHCLRYVRPLVELVRNAVAMAKVERTGWYPGTPLHSAYAAKHGLHSIEPRKAEMRAHARQSRETMESHMVWRCEQFACCLWGGQLRVVTRDGAYALQKFDADSSDLHVFIISGNDLVTDSR